MLYRLAPTIDRLEPLKFIDFAQAKALEKDLEDLLADNLLETLFEGDPLLPFFQERRMQAEADIYALDRDGNLVVFELKRAGAGRGALEQLFRYVETASQWDYARLNQKYQEYCRTKKRQLVELSVAHQQAFGLAQSIEPDDFNMSQRMCVVANSAEDGLVDAVSYWRKRGLAVDFLPYRVYELHGELYFEFFSKPFDIHPNQGETKGVLVDTNSSYDVAGEEPWVQTMIENRRISAYGGTKSAMDSLCKGDTVFYYQKGAGIIAAARITGARPIDYEPDDERYWDVEFLTATPKSFGPPWKALGVAQIRDCVGNFFWARTLKVPYLNQEETAKLLAEAIQALGPAER